MENQNNEHTDPWDMTENIYEILANDLSGEPLSTEEARLFEAWKQAHPANQAIYRQFRSLMERNSGILRGTDRTRCPTNKTGRIQSPVATSHGRSYTTKRPSTGIHHG